MWKSACAAIGFPCFFLAVRESYKPLENPASILLRKNWRWTEPAVGYRNFREKSRCATITFCSNPIGRRILYSPFGKRPADVDWWAFSAYRIRFSAFQYTYTTPPKMARKSHCGATTFCGLNAENKEIVLNKNTQSFLFLKKCYHRCDFFDRKSYY